MTVPQLYSIIATIYTTKSFKKCSISNDLDGTEDDVLWTEQHDKSDTDEEGDNMYDDMTQEQIQQMFSKESDDDFLGFESILLTLVRLI